MGAIIITRPTLEEMGEALVGVQRQQIIARKNRDGQSFPPGVDLYQSGRLLNTLRYRIEGQELFLESPVGYAEALDVRYKWAGLCPEYQAKLEARWEVLLAAEGAVTYQET